MSLFFYSKTVLFEFIGMHRESLLKAGKDKPIMTVDYTNPVDGNMELSEVEIFPPLICPLSLLINIIFMIILLDDKELSVLK